MYRWQKVEYGECERVEDLPVGATLVGADKGMEWEDPECDLLAAVRQLQGVVSVILEDE